MQRAEEIVYDRNEHSVSLSKTKWSVLKAYRNNIIQIKQVVSMHLGMLTYL